MTEPVSSKHTNRASVTSAAAGDDAKAFEGTSENKAGISHTVELDSSQSTSKSVGSKKHEKQFAANQTELISKDRTLYLNKEQKVGDIECNNVLLKNSESECVHNKSESLEDLEESSVGASVKMSEGEMTSPAKRNMHTSHLNEDMTDFTNNNDVKSTPHQARTDLTKKSLPGHFAPSGFIGMEKRNGHMENKHRDFGLNVRDTKFDFEEDEHADLVIDEGVDTDPPPRRSSLEESSKYLDSSTTIQALTRDFAGPQFTSRSQYTGDISPLLNHNGYQFSTSVPKNNPKQVSQVSPSTKGMESLKSPASMSAVVKPRCAPVREAVDPAKYITVQEGDGVKYACSKCGNIYKWRKSLNKHWKEKHDGEVLEPRTGLPTIPIPRGNGQAGTFRTAGPRTNYNSLSQVSPRSMPTSPKEKSYTSSLSHTAGFPNNPFTTKPYASTKTFGLGKMYQPDSPKGPSSAVSSSNRKSLDSQRQHRGSKVPGSVMMQYLTKPSPAKLPQEKLSKSQVTHSPPQAHSNKPTPQYIPPRPTSAEVPVDLTRELLFPSNRLTDPESVLDLSKKASYSHSLVTEPPQDEPLDFSSKKTTSNSSSKDSVVLENYSTKKTEYHNKSVNDEVMYYSPPITTKCEPSKLYACNMCTYVARNHSDLELHKELHSNDSQYFLCAECHETCTSLESLNQHFALKHLDSLVKQKADLHKEGATSSSTELQNSAGPQLYKYLTMESNRNTMSCIVCGIIYQWQWALAKHFEQDHPTLPNPYQKEKASEKDQERMSCSLSPVSTANAAEPVVYQCQTCSFVAGSKSDLTRHQILHSLNKHHVCKVCGYTAKAQDELLDHYASEHPNVDPKDLKSTTGTVIIGATAEDSDESISDATATQILGPDGKSLIDFSPENTAIVIPQAPEDSNANQGNNRSKAGRKPNTGNSPSSVDVLLPYKCNTCEYRARWPSEITQHMKNHSDEKPFHCPRCTYKSKWKWDVVKHLKRCGGGTVKDVIDTTKLKRNHHVQNLFEGNESITFTQTRELSKGPPNVTVMQEGSVERTAYHSMLDRNQCLIGEEEGINLTQQMRNSEILSVGEQSPGSYSDDGSTVHQCSVCPYIGRTDKELSHHMLVHLERSPFKGKASDIMGTSHMQNDDQAEGSTGDESMEEESIQYRCELCPYSTNKSRFFQAHQMKHRSGEKSSFICKQCGEESEDLTSFLQHKQSHSESLRAYGDEESTKYSNNAEGESEWKEHGASSNRRKQPKKTIIKTVVLDDDQESDEYQEAQAKARGEADNSSRYICQYCPYVTNTRTHFDAHIPHHESVSKYQCEWCSWSSDKMNLLSRHVQDLHPGQATKDEKEDFYHKLKDRSSYQSYSSPNNSPSFDSHFDDLKETKSFNGFGGMKRGNVFSEGKKTKRRLKTCVKCGYVTDNVTTLQRHMAKHGKNGKYTCTHCDYSVDKQHVLDYHLRLVHARELPNPATMMGTLEADNTSNSTVDFNDNVSNNGNSSNGENLADEESVNFEEAEASTVHGEDVKIVHVGTRTVYGCTKCPYHTMKISGVLNHSRQHGQKKKYSCTYCNYSVDQSAHVKNHMKTVHGHNAEFISHKEIETVHSVNMGDMDTTEVASNGNDFELPEEMDDTEFEPEKKKPRLEGSETMKGSDPSLFVYRCSKCMHVSKDKIEWMKHKLVHMDENRSTEYNKPASRNSMSPPSVDKSDADSDALTEYETNNPSSPSEEKSYAAIDINSNTALSNHA